MLGGIGLTRGDIVGALGVILGVISIIFYIYF
jgi:hypothetical protein